MSVGLQQRLDDRIVLILQFADRRPKTGRKRDAIADAGFDVPPQLRLHQVNIARIAFLKN
jgi:hypothetical protein